MPHARPESVLLVVACAIATLLGFSPAGAEPGGAPPRASASASGAPPPPPIVERSVLYPAPRVPLRFDHSRHAERLGLSCAYCHTAAATSRRAADSLQAPPARCDACHGSDHDDLAAVRPGVGPAKECAYCHEGHRPEDGNRVARVVVKTPHLRFDHAAHRARGVPCARCHADVTTAPLGADRFPAMATCLECHRAGGTAAGRATCDTCHLTELGRLVTHFPEGDLKPLAWMHDAEHGPDFILRHRTVAAADSAFCATCHSERDCTDCHDGRVRPRSVHPNDWLGLHPVAARQNDPPCTSCHREQSFCLSCHQRVGLAFSSPTGAAAERGRFHPPKAVWTDAPRTPQHHSWEAERNVAACVSCHTERDCALCHATATRGGRGGLSPHPAGFESSCRTALAKNGRPCLYCHDEADGSLARCR
ncbi:MAG TPA: cytochrome c3 family protein [Polyangiaceae bacterium]|nr:cytochrome c3 family protein [Polyangiaceae bacterium]